MQVTARIPDEGNKLAGGIPTVADVKGLQLNVSLAGDPEVTSARLLLRDWGRFQSPRGAFQECPYRRRLPPGTLGSAGGGGRRITGWARCRGALALPVAGGWCGRRSAAQRGSWQPARGGGRPSERQCWKPERSCAGGCCSRTGCEQGRGWPRQSAGRGNAAA